ncbi:Eco57I restriction-modification methylase domain-containing protein [Sporomusa termitida]|uniref:site-specific DNA-methyltransferase (adenine-specific) n=1 Tax=Sporomusa termitida TaxID=2377 RepID=A0A517E0Z5_9FIRM|nr:TaqI-like C-terminal specificity domain-containing protein [Sporomusa termitida]QDR83275.1 type II restriction m6 adenine DNA methyltransferase, Alw26I/Eco31I/Esp3I family [Sporomusa termitida]
MVLKAEKRQACKAAGVFYTPEPIVNYILKHTLAKHDVVANPAPRVLDPACGSGNFLVAAYELLLEKFTADLVLLRQRYGRHQYTIKSGKGETRLTGIQYWQPENLHYHIISCCLYGADVDADAVAAAKLRLAEKGGGKVVSADDQLLVCDSLIKWEKADLADNYDRRTPHFEPAVRFWGLEFDYIVGNPPYISFGLNRAGKMPVDQAEYLKRNYPHSAQYKLSYYALFFERSIQALKTGGYLGFITPDSYLLGRYYSKIREYILKTCSIKAISLVKSNVFAGVLVGIPAITILQKINRDSAETAVAVSKIDNSGLSIDTYQYEQQYFARQVYNRFRLFFHANDKILIDKIEQAPYMFKDLTKTRTGMRSLTTQADIKGKAKLGPTWQRGLISSGQVLPFGLNYQGDWLDVNPDKLNKGGWNAAIMAGPKIFLRQTGDSLIATIDRSGLYHLNNIHSLVALRAGINLEFLVCILNSKLMNYYYHTVTLEKGRPMAQVDIETVEKLPLMTDRHYTDKLERLGLKLAPRSGAVCCNSLEPHTETRTAGEFAALFNEMNTLVYNLYGLSDSEISYIEQAEVFKPEKFYKE